MRRRAFLFIGLGSLGVVACADPQDQPTPEPSPDDSDVADRGDQEFPDVLGAELTSEDDGYMIAVTISSPYDTPERYADGWRVLTPDGEVLAEHDLAHDHANEQPFTRSRGPFTVPEDVDEVVVEGRDLANGYGGATVTVSVPRQD